MKKALIILAACLMTFQAVAQTTSADYKARYERLVSKVGIAGVGVENVLDKWAQVDSCDVDLLIARFAMYFEKSKSYVVETRNTKKYLGLDPILNLKDSLGVDTYYYQVPSYDDGIFGNAMRNIDKAIKLYPEMLDLRVNKATALLAYEKDSPDLSSDFLMSLINDWNAKKYKWTFEGVDKIDQEFFSALMQEYCISLFTISSDKSLDAFKAISEKMLTIDKTNLDFTCNLGSYYTKKKEYKKSLKYYDKALKISPDCYPAIKNSCNIAIVLKDKKLMQKYLPSMVKYGSEAESASAKVRLESL